MLTEYEQQALKEAEWEFKEADPVAKNVGYRHFVSRSKGRRNGKKRYRRTLKEVELVRFQTGWHYPHRAKIDEMASELTKGRMGDDDLLWYIRRYCGPDAGCMWASGVL